MASRSFASRYLAALAFLAGALLVRWLLDPLLGERLPLSTVYVAVVFAVLWGGSGPAIVTALLGYALADVFFMDPRGYIGLGNYNFPAMGMFLASASVIIYLGYRLQDERMRRTSDQRAAQAAQLAALDALPVLVSAMDANGVLAYWNAEAERVTGYKAAELVGNPRALEILYPDSGYRARMLADWSARGGTYRDWVWEARCKDGSTRRIAWSNVGAPAPLLGWARWGVGQDVTERLALEDQVQRQLSEVVAAETQARLALEATQLGRYSWFPPDTVIADARVREIAGYAPHLPMTLADVNAHIHPDDVALVQQARRGALDPKGSGTFVAEYRIVRDDGAERWVSSRGLVEWDGEGASRVPRAMHGTLLDITARVRGEERLRIAEEGQRLLVAVHDAARASGDPEEVLWNVVRATGRHYAASRCLYGEIDAAEEAVLVHRDYVDGVGSVIGTHRLADFGPELIADLKAGRTVAIADVAKDPRTSAALDAFAAVQTRAILCVPLVKDGRFLAMLLLNQATPRPWSEHDADLLEQVAERTWFVMETARAQEALRESRDVLALAMQGSRMGAWSRDLVTDRVWWSPELEALFGLPPGSFGGDHQSFHRLVHPEDVELVARAVERALATGGDYAVEFRFRHANGDWRWMEGRGKAIYLADGTPAMLYGLGMDISERKEAEHALREADRRKDEFLATLAHELRNPLAPIRNAVELLRLQHGKDEGVQRLRGLIDRQLRQLTRLVDDLLEVSRITRGVIALRRERMELADAVNAALETVRPQVEEGRHALEVRLPREPIVLDADQARITQVLQNLLHNAARYTPPGGHILLDVAKEGEVARITVRDDGVGIPAEHLAHVFDMFMRVPTTNARHQEGLGIGLALVKGIVEMHGGTVTVRSDGAGRGSEFTVRLPSGEPVRQ